MKRWLALEKKRKGVIKMLLLYNRFAVMPHLCCKCKKYIWLEPYRRADVLFMDRFLKSNICRGCLTKYGIAE